MEDGRWKMEDGRWKIEDARVGGMIAGHDLPPPPKRRTLHSNSNLELELRTRTATSPERADEGFLMNDGGDQVPTLSGCLRQN